MGHNAIKQLDEMGIYDGSERTMANIGRILGIVSAFVLLGQALLVLAAHR